MMMYLPAIDATFVALCNEQSLAGNSNTVYLVLGLAAYLYPERCPKGV